MFKKWTYVIYYNYHPCCFCSSWQKSPKTINQRSRRLSFVLWPDRKKATSRGRMWSLSAERGCPHPRQSPAHQGLHLQHQRGPTPSRRVSRKRSTGLNVWSDIEDGKLKKTFYKLISQTGDSSEQEQDKCTNWCYDIYSGIFRGENNQRITD